MNPPRRRYGNIELSENDVLPYSAGSVYPAPLPGFPRRVEIRALFGPDEAIQSCPHDVFFVDPDTETVLEKQIEYKNKTFLPKAGSNYYLSGVPILFREKSSLTDSELITVAKQARNIRGVRAEFIVQEDAVFFREIAPYDPKEVWHHFEKDEALEGPVIRVGSQRDLSKIKGTRPIIYMGPETFQERTTNLFIQTANTENSQITALVHGAHKNLPLCEGAFRQGA
jgi:phosphoenolpyruvate synthase/pyruvate phosphate dikinase